MALLLGMSFGSIPSQAQTFAYVTNQGISGDVSVIATASNTVVATVPVGGFPIGVAITPDGTFAYVTNIQSDAVSINCHRQQHGRGYGSCGEQQELITAVDPKRSMTTYFVYLIKETDVKRTK